MSSELRLILFDVDGTLVDSQADIVASMGAAFAHAGRAAPLRDQILGIVGLSLDHAMARLAPDADDTLRADMVTAYKAEYMRLRAASGAQSSSPLYPGARDLLDRLSQRDEVLLGVATGKSQRGLDALIAGHGLEGLFLTRQTADHHPSKPHPSMIEAAMTEAGVTRQQTVMIGDTSFDMEMARAAGVHALGVRWGYHAPAQLSAAHRIVSDMDELARVLDNLWSEAQ